MPRSTLDQAPLKKALAPSSLAIFLQQSKVPVYMMSAVEANGRGRPVTLEESGFASERRQHAMPSVSHSGNESQLQNSQRETPSPADLSGRLAYRSLSFNSRTVAVSQLTHRPPDCKAGAEQRGRAVVRRGVPCPFTDEKTEAWSPDHTSPGSHSEKSCDCSAEPQETNT